MVSFLNPHSLGIIDDMFYRLPFPDGGRMDKLHDAHGVTGVAVYFRTELQADFEEPNAMNDLTLGWGAYLDLHVTDAAGSLNPGRQSLISRRARCASPTQSDDEKVRLSHWYILACR